MNIFEEKKLTNPAHVEQVSATHHSCLLVTKSYYNQCCATGLTTEGKSAKNIVEEMVPLLDSKELRCALLDCRLSRK